MPIATSSDLLAIGDLSHQSQTPVKTLRHYEELGLIQAAQRPASEQRQFAADCLPRLAFIKQARGLGLSLLEIGHLLTLHDQAIHDQALHAQALHNQAEQPGAEVKPALYDKIEAIDQRIQALNQLKVHLQHLIAETESAARPMPAVGSIIDPIAPASGGAKVAPPAERPRAV